ncbi:MAG TPA: aldose 1-epimerase [Planctomycetaceae bacterium]
MEHLTLTDLDSGSTARIAVAFGFNCYEFVAALGGRRVDVIASQPEFVERGEKPSRSGIPILFPFPNRIKGGRFVWDGREYVLPKDRVGYNLDNAIHGFCLDRPWRVTRRTANGATGEFRLSRDAAECRDCWPADFVIEVRYEVLGPALRCDVRVTNPDAVPLPFGFGTHPYFKLPLAGDSRFEDCLVQAPAAERYELIDNLPTGRTVPAEETIDLREGVALGGLKLDDVYTGLSYEPHGLVTRVVDPKAGLEVVQTCDRSFRELVLLTPFWAQAVCVEPYTCTTDAIHLQEQGFDAGLRVLKPGEEFRTWFELRVRPVTA